MKAVFSKSIWLIFFFAFLISCGSDNKQISSENSQIVSANFEIKGMSCAMGCAKMIEKKLAATAGVNAIQVNFENENAQIEFDQSQIKPENLKEILESLHGGDTYIMGKFEISDNTPNKNNVLDEGKAEKADLKKQTSLNRIQFPSIFELIKKFLPAA